MPITYSINEELGVIFSVARGVLTEAELLEHKRSLVRDPDVRPNMIELTDVRGIDDLEISASGLRLFTAMDATNREAMGPDYKLALVLPRDLVVQGLGKVYSNMAGKRLGSVGIFEDIESAREWLGLT